MTHSTLTLEANYNYKGGGAKLTKRVCLYFQCLLQLLDGLANPPPLDLLATLVYCMSLPYVTV